MQVYQSSLGESARPCAPRDCPECRGCQHFQKHGCYRRYSAAEGERDVVVQRYLCPRCGHTWSVIPPGMMPYRSMGVARFETLLDERFGWADEGARPPPATEVEEGCIRRACTRLSERKTLLCGLFGQQMPVLGGWDIGCFWRAMRELGSTADILVAMARDFKAALLGNYHSLRSHWERNPAAH